jgi:hypothetical protein
MSLFYFHAEIVVSLTYEVSMEKVLPGDGFKIKIESQQQKSMLLNKKKEK